MKYRTGFVTNSSSSSFGAAGISVLMALIAIFLGACGNGKKNEENDPTDALRTTTTPKDSILKCDGNPLWVYAQFVDINDKGEEQVNTAATASIQFNVTEGFNFAKKEIEQLAGTWMAADIYGVKATKETGTPPQKI